MIHDFILYTQNNTEIYLRVRACVNQLALTLDDLYLNALLLANDSIYMSVCTFFLCVYDSMFIFCVHAHNNASLADQFVYGVKTELHKCNLCQALLCLVKSRDVFVVEIAASYSQKVTCQYKNHDTSRNFPYWSYP